MISSTPPRSEEMVVMRASPWQSMFAGMIAGIIEAGVTYPFEWAKTVRQFAPRDSKTKQVKNPIVLISSAVREHGARTIYSGCTSLIAGSAVKAAVRFGTFDSIKGVLQDDRGKLSPGNGVIAGLGAGILESVLAVTPFETVKTALIEDAKLARPKYRGLSHGSYSLVKGQGIGGVYKGFVAVTLRQGANSAVRMGSYNAINGILQNHQTDPSTKLSVGKTFAVGAAAGVITVYTTMPFDTVKTRMQSLAAKSQYKSTFHCAAKIFREEGVTAYWSGSTARMSRLVLSGGIVFSVYERVMSYFSRIHPKTLVTDSLL